MSRVQPLNFIVSFRKWKFGYKQSKSHSPSGCKPCLFPVQRYEKDEVGKRVGSSPFGGTNDFIGFWILSYSFLHPPAPSTHSLLGHIPSMANLVDLVLMGPHLIFLSYLEVPDSLDHQHSEGLTQSQKV